MRGGRPGAAANPCMAKPRSGSGGGIKPACMSARRLARPLTAPTAYRKGALALAAWHRYRVKGCALAVAGSLAG